MNRGKKILFIAEDITLAQVVRLKVLAQSIQHLPMEVYFACSHFPELIFSDCVFKQIKINNIGHETARLAVQNCTRLYDETMLEQYIAEDVALIHSIQPDLIIADFRLSLCISSAIAKTPLVTLINAYWSPYAVRKGFPMPDHPMEDYVGMDLMQSFYPLARPFVFQYFIHPFNKLRKKYGLKVIPGLLELLTYGDYVLYPDVEGMHCMKELPGHHVFLGNVPWSPPIVLSPQTEETMKHPYIYATMGSSGRTDKMKEIMKGFSRLPCQVLLATAGFPMPEPPPNVILEKYLPGSLLARHASLVISNGGSTTGYQALSEGRPLLGIASNMDQYLCMENIRQRKAGKLLRGGAVKEKEVFGAVTEIMRDPSYQSAAQDLAIMLRNEDCKVNFVKFLKGISML